MKNTVFTVITAVLLLATLCLMAVGAGVRAKCRELEGNGAKPIQAVNAESLNVANDYDTIVNADTRDGVVYLSLISGSQPIPNACGLTPKNPSDEWTGWGGPLDTDNATVGEGPGSRNKIVTGGYYFKRGLGAHAVSTLVYDLSGDTYTRFEGWIGMSDEKDPGNRFCADGGRSNFNFLLDGRVVHHSGPLEGVILGEANPHPEKVVFDIPSTARELTIVMGDGGNGIDCDHPVIGDAKLLTSRVTGEGPALVTVASIAQPPVQPPVTQPVTVQQPVWEFQRRFRPHPDTFGATEYIEDIGFYGNSQVFFARSSRLYKWDMSTGRYWWITHQRLFGGDVQHIEVSESHDIFAYNIGAQLQLRRASDLEFIASVNIPDSLDDMAMEPRTNYLWVTGMKDQETGLSDLRVYDLWENNSWGLNLVTEFSGNRAEHIDILSTDYTYTTNGASNSWILERPTRSINAWGAELFWLKETDRRIHDRIPVGVAAGRTSDGVRIATITSRSHLHVWDWHANRLYTHQFNSLNPRSFQFTPNREILTWIDDENDEIVFWDVTARKVDAVVELEETTNFRCHAFSKDGKTMAVGDNNGTVHIYKWTGGSALSAPAKETERSQPTALLSNYPNPFNPETWIPYQLSEAAEVTVTIHSLDGKLVRTLELGQVPAGAYSDKGRAAYWDGRNAQGEPVASGVYFYTLTAGDFKATRKMVIRK